MDPRCGCCEGVEPRTPRSVANRPGLPALRYRVGTHATFLESMRARLSLHVLPEEVQADGTVRPEIRPLAGLTTRAPHDPALALLDAWAVVGEVLTFYQERIANEGYLGTATERRSLLELARLLGYRPRPGVASTVYLAFTLEEGFDGEVPAGTRAQSVPGPDELPQPFETEEPLPARAAWNAIRARQERPTLLLPHFDDELREVWVEGAVQEVKVNQLLLLDAGSWQSAYRVVEVESDPAGDRTRIGYVVYGNLAGTPSTGAGAGDMALRQVTRSDLQESMPHPLTRLGPVVQGLRQAPSTPPASRFQLARSLETTYGVGSDLGPRLLAALQPRLAGTLYAAYRSVPVTGPPDGATYRAVALPLQVGVFGHNAPPPPTILRSTTAPASVEGPHALSLDGVHEGIAQGSLVAIERPDLNAPIIARVQGVRTRSRSDYGLSMRVTELLLDRNPWGPGGSETLDHVRSTTVHLRSLPLEAAPEPIPQDVAGDTVEVDDLLDGLEAGRWMVVRGERADLLDAAGRPVEGVEAQELVMLAGVEQDVHRREDGREEEVADTLHSRLLLAEPLAYRYRRETVTINANVARASHGETVEEVLGSGSGAKGNQAFALKRPRLTHLPAPTPSGTRSTLEVRVDGVRWREAPSLLELEPGDRAHFTERDDQEGTTVVFGDGRRGARLPTGVQNVSAVYRHGLGREGNVAAGAISMLATRPLGVKEVVNPVPATGGGDPEDREAIRRNLPLAAQALDRLVSLEDHAHFARSFAGIGKAVVRRVSDGRREGIRLTIAGEADTPIPEGSELHRNLLLALRRLGDPATPVEVVLREPVFLVLGARVRVHPDHRWDDVEPRIRSALLDRYGFPAREIGEGLRSSGVLAALHGIPGVEKVVLELLGGIAGADAEDPEVLARRLEALREGPVPHVLRMPPDHLAYLNPDLPDTLILQEVAP